MQATTRWAAALFFIWVGACGGGGGHRAVTYVLEQSVPFAVPAGVCDAVSGPFLVGTGSMSFTIVDTPTGIGNDSMEVGIMSDANFLSGGCNFNLAIVDDVANGSVADSGPVDAGTYDFIVGCSNIIDDCLFQLTWTATY
jgi:hypothetical protein